MPELFEVFWKSLAVFFLLVILTRMIGKKLLSQMTFFDFVIGISIGTIAGAYVAVAVKGAWVLISPVVLTLAVMLMGFLTMKSLPARKIIEGEPVIVIQNGKILENNMFKLRYNLDDLEMQLRSKDVFDIGQVEFAVLEPNGQLSVLKKTPYLPVTPKDLNIPTNYLGLPTEIIKDGQVLEQNLTQNNLNFTWLYNELRRLKIEDISRIVLASLNTNGTLYIDQRQDQLSYVQKVED